MEIKILNNDKNSVELEIKDLDFSVPSLLVDELYNNKNVEMAAFKIPHQLIRTIRMLIKTKKGDPLDALVVSAEKIKKDVSELRKLFKSAVK